jgi:hypothetical protein
LTRLAVQLENCPKNRTIANTVISDNSADYQNSGMSYLNCPDNLIKSNIVQAGVGIGLALDVNGSNVLCNTLQYCVKGIGPGWSSIRLPGSQHGESGIRGRQNTFVSNTFDIEMYYSNTANYQWICPNTTNINYAPGGTYGTNIVYSTAEANPCNGSKGLMAGNTSSSSSASSFQAPANMPLNYSNDVSVAQSKSKEFIDGMQTIKVSGTSALAANNLSALAKAQTCMENKDYAGCNTHLNSLSKGMSLVESNLATVLGILNTMKQQGRINYTLSEKTALESVAQSDSRIGGQGVHYARAILLTNYNLHFNDPYMVSTTPATGMRMGQTATSNNMVEKQLVGLYPNPAKSTITLSTTEGEKTITVWNSLGQKAYSNTTEGSLNIDISAWNNGVYLVEIYDTIANKKEMTKFIKE